MMQLKRIRLKNYRRYRDEEIEFPTGITGIVGRNGSGKSTLIEAIGWCMYGNHAARTKKDEIRTTGVQKDQNCSVALEIVLGSDTIRIVRELRGKNASGHASVFVNGSTSAQVHGMTEVSEFVTKRTGMDYVAFFISVFARQKDLDALSVQLPGERKKTIMRLLRINRIDDAIAAIKNDIRTGRDKIELLESGLRDIEPLQKRQKEASEERGQAMKQIKELSDAVKRFEVEIKRKKAEHSVHKKRHQEHITASKEHVRIEVQIRSETARKETADSDLRGAKGSEVMLQGIQPQVKECAAAKTEKGRLDQQQIKFERKTDLEKQYASMNPKIKRQASANKKAKDALAKLHGLEQELKRQKTKLANQEVRKEEIAKSISATSAKISEKQSQRSEITAEFSKIKESGEGGSCPTCKRPLEDHFAHVSRYFAGEISELDREIKAELGRKEEPKRQLRSAENEIKKISKEIAKAEDAKTRKTTLQANLKGGQKSLAVKNRERSALAKRLEKFSSLEYDSRHHRLVNKRFSELAKIKDESIRLSADAKKIPLLSRRYKRSLDAIERLGKRSEAATKRLESIGYDKLKHEESEQRLERSVDEHRLAREGRIELEGSKKVITSEIRQIAETIREERAKQAEIDSENARIGSRSKLEHVMNGFRQNLISRIRPMLSQRSSELLRDVTRGKYPVMGLDEDYNIRIEDDGGRFTTDRFSGGEGDLANLCLRIAISQELAERSGGMQVNFIALDEIFGSQDEGRKRSILEALSALSSRFRQILVITHVEDIKEMLPYVLTVKEGYGNTVRIETEGIAPSGIKISGQAGS